MMTRAHRSLLVLLLAFAPLAAGPADPPHAEWARERGRRLEDAGRLRAQGHLAEAVVLVEQVLAHDRQAFGEIHEKVAESQDQLAELHVMREDFAAARRAVSEALLIRSRLYPASDWRVTDARLAQTEVECLAGLDHEQRLALLEAGQLTRRAVTLREQARFPEAVEAAARSVLIYRKVLGEENRLYSGGLAALALLCKDIGECTKAERYNRRTLEIRRKLLGTEHPEYALILNNLGSLYFSLGDYARARPLLAEALAIRRRTLGETHPLTANSLGNLGVLAQGAGEFGQAEVYFRQAAEVLTKTQGEMSLPYAVSLNNLGALYQELGDFGKAEPLFRRALEIREQLQGEEDPAYAVSLNNLALLYGNTGEYARALPLLTRALAIRRKVLGKGHPDYAMSLGHLARLYLELQQPEKAEPLYREVLNTWAETAGEGHPAYATTLCNLALVYQDLGDFARAEPLYREAAERLRNCLGDGHPAYGICLHNLTFLYLAMERPEDALATITRCLEVEQGNLERVFSFTGEQAMYAYLARVTFSYDALFSVLTRCKPSPARAQVALTWTLRRKAVVLDTICRYREGQRLLERDPQAAGLALHLRGLRERFSKLPLNAPLTMDKGRLQQELVSLHEQIEQHEARLNRALVAQHPQPPREVTVSEVQLRLPPESALVEFVRVWLSDSRPRKEQPPPPSSHYFALVLPTGREIPATLLDLGDAEEIDEAIHEARDQLAHTPRDLQMTGEKELEVGFRATAAALGQKVFTPLVPLLKDTKLLYVAPDGELNRLPFEALCTANGEYLVETWRFAYLSSGRDLLRPNVEFGRGTFVFAGPDFDLQPLQRGATARMLLAGLSVEPRPTMRGASPPDVRGLRWKQLSGAAEEAADVKQALENTPRGPVHLFVGKEALEEVLKAMVSPRVLHVATHGFFLPNQEQAAEDLRRPEALETELGAVGGLARLRGLRNPLLRTGLVLAGANTLGRNEPGPGTVDDGWVTAEEIASMDLQGTELVVLSACESGLGDVKVGEGVQGLRRAFLFAGARTLVVSLFEVPDVETRLLMQRFYGHLHTGDGRLAALQAARLESIRQRRLERGAAHPFFWASFVLVGDPGK